VAYYPLNFLTSNPVILLLDLFESLVSARVYKNHVFSYNDIKDLIPWFRITRLVIPLRFAVKLVVNNLIALCLLLDIGILRTSCLGIREGKKDLNTTLFVRLEALFTDVLVVLNHIHKTIINLLRKAFFTGHVLVRSFRL
jgi:hypothetical protein